LLIILSSVSSTSQSRLEFTFDGDAVSLFGPVGPNGTTYSVSVNTASFGLASNYSTRKDNSRSNVMLYHASSLGKGSHTLTLTVLNDDPTTQGAFALDYAQVYTTPSLGGKKMGFIIP